MEATYTNIYYFYCLSDIGGTETFLYELAKKYQDIDLTIVYRFANVNQIKRLQQYVRCVQFIDGMKLKCKRAFFNYGIDIIDSIEAEDYCFVIHADYEDMKKRGQLQKIPEHLKLNKYIAVSKRAAEGFRAVTGKMPIVSYNPFEVRKPKKVLNLISATRLSREKGKDRMIQFANLLDAEGIKYIWTIFTNDKNEINNPNIIYMQPRLNILDYIANADYLVQLSDNEGYCYSVVEALCAGVPVIVTPCPVFEELGLVDGKNCYKLPFDMKDVDVQKIYNNIPKFTYTPLKDSWDKLLIHEPNPWKKIRNNRYKVIAKSIYQEKNISDAELGRVPKPGEPWIVDYDRMIFLTGKNPRHTAFVKVVKILEPGEE